MFDSFEAIDAGDFYWWGMQALLLLSWVVSFRGRLTISALFVYTLVMALYFKSKIGLSRDGFYEPLHWWPLVAMIAVIAVAYQVWREPRAAANRLREERDRAKQLEIRERVRAGNERRKQASLVKQRKSSSDSR